MIADAFLRAKRGLPAPAKEQFIALAEVHFDLHQRVYGSRFVKPKHHYVLHNAAQELLKISPSPPVCVALALGVFEGAPSNATDRNRTPRR